MTILTPDDTLPILFKSPEEFDKRPGYQPQLTCTRDQLEKIVGKYTFTKEQQLECGLNGCRTKHWHGWVIRTKDGKETHCGKNCGERDFDVVFKEVEAVFKAAVERQSKKDRLEQIGRDRDALLADARGLYEKVSAAGKRIQAVLNEIKRDVALERAFESCMRSGGRILVEDEESKRLRAAMGANAAKADLKVIGIIKGTSAVFDAARAASELKYKIISPLQDLTTENLNALPDKELSAKTQAFSSMQQTISSAKNFLSAFEQFNSPSNAQAFVLLQQSMPKKARTGRVGRIVERITLIYSGTERL